MRDGQRKDNEDIDLSQNDSTVAKNVEPADEELPCETQRRLSWCANANAKARVKDDVNMNRWTKCYQQLKQFWKCSVISNVFLEGVFIIRQRA